MSKQPAVYILASRERGTLYIGVTGNLKARIWNIARAWLRGSPANTT
jgi:putative endonuclease